MEELGYRCCHLGIQIQKQFHLLHSFLWTWVLVMYLGSRFSQPQNLPPLVKRELVVIEENNFKPTLIHVRSAMPRPQQFKILLGTLGVVLAFWAVLCKRFP